VRAAARASFAPQLSLGLLLLVVGATAQLLHAPLAHVLGHRAIGSPYDIERMVLLYATLPRLAMAALCGAALAVSGTVLQQLLSNPLASPTTLGVDAGARLALAVATVFAPGLLHWGRDLVALAGSAASTALVFWMVRRREFSALSIVLAGLVVSLFCGALAAMLSLVEARELTSLFIWGGGSLSQQSWSPFLSLTLRLAFLVVPLALLWRPLSLLDAGEESARSLGLSAVKVRIAAIGVAVAISALVASAVGVIGFLGLVAPSMARLAGARRFGAQLAWSAIIGSLVLLLTDLAVQLFAGASADFIPTGAVTAVIGSPLLLFLLPRLRSAMRPPMLPEARPVAALPRRWVIAIIATFVLFAALSVLVGRDAGGSWTVLGESWNTIRTWRLPRVLATGASGALLAMAGVILQRLTDNELASPEVLGVSAGSILAVALGLFVFGDLSALSQDAFAMLGSLAVLLTILALGARASFSPDRMLLAGIALTALVDAIVGAVSASGDPRAFQLLAWMAGSAAGATYEEALLAVGAALLVLAAGLLLARWLRILPLGAPVSIALGVRLGRARLLLLILAAAASAAATPILGPLTFIGLVAPHFVTALGVRKPVALLAGSAGAGAGIMSAADWLARTLAFPLQLPTGLLAAMVGAPFLMVLINRRGAR
jgi:ferric hydroxamate transport system permease protein